MSPRRTALLVVLDGWGHREEAEGNAIARARTPVWDALWSRRPRALIRTSGAAVGLPEGQMGNSEVGHMNLGAGRVVHQSLTRIDGDIRDGGFARNPVLAGAVDAALGNGAALHALGLLSPGGIHSHEDQIMALLELARGRGVERLYLHAFLDGRDTPPRSALPSLERADAWLRGTGAGRIASVCGRFYAMDRDGRWERVRPVYEMLTEGTAPFRFPDAAAALEAAYGRGEDDEFARPTLTGPAGEPPAAVADGDAVVFMNFRADRARQLARAFADEAFSGFERRVRPATGAFATLTEYAADIDAPCAYPPQELRGVLGQHLSALGKTQLRIAETEKYAHVTFFLNGGREAPFEGEERVLVPSPKVKTYDLKPEMAAAEVTDRLVDAVGSGRFDAIVCNYANGDMVGHTGDFDAAVKAVEALDGCLGRLVAAVESAGGQMLVTADHGNAERMFDAATGQPLTSHTDGPVPLVYVGDADIALADGGSLCDVAPTLLTLMGLPVPDEMSGRALLESAPPARRAAR